MSEDKKHFLLVRTMEWNGVRWDDIQESQTLFFDKKSNLYSYLREKYKDSKKTQVAKIKIYSYRQEGRTLQDWVFINGMYM